MGNVRWLCSSIKISTSIDFSLRIVTVEREMEFLCHKLKQVEMRVCQRLKEVPYKRVDHKVGLLITQIPLKKTWKMLFVSLRLVTQIQISLRRMTN